MSSPPGPGLEILPTGVVRALQADHAPAGKEPELTEDEIYFADRARAANTRRGYRSDLEHFARWCAGEGRAPLPAAADSVSGYLIYLAHNGAKVPTMSRRLSSIAYVHRFAGHPNPVDTPRVLGVWEGIRREQAQPVDQAPALMPPVLWKILGALPDDVSGIRDRALLLVGFVAALRRSELAAIQVGHLAEHPKGLVLTIPRSKTDPRGEGQLVVLPHSILPEHCPVIALGTWLKAAALEESYVFRRIHRNGRSVMPMRTRALADGTQVALPGMSAAAINDAVQRACCRALGQEKGMTYSAHSLRAGFATFAARHGASDRAIAHQTRHRSLASLDQYIRFEGAWEDNAATALGL